MGIQVTQQPITALPGYFLRMKGWHTTHQENKVNLNFKTQNVTFEDTLRLYQLRGEIEGLLSQLNLICCDGEITLHIDLATQVADTRGNLKVYSAEGMHLVRPIVTRIEAAAKELLNINGEHATLNASFNQKAQLKQVS